MTPDENKAKIRRFYEEVWNRGNLDYADEVFAEDYVRHDPTGSAPAQGPEGQKQIVSLFRAAFADVAYTLDLLVAEGDIVVARWTIHATHTGLFAGRPPTGKPVALTGVNIYRFSGDKVVELWNHRDDLGLSKQLGLV